MGQQTGFYATSKDYEIVLQRIEELGLICVPRAVRPGASVVFSHAKNFVLAKNHPSYYVLPQELCAEDLAFLDLAVNPPMLRVNPHSSPAIEVAPCPMKEGALQNGRIHLALSPDHYLYSTLVKKYNQLVTPIRKWAKTDKFGFYVGPDASATASRGGIKLMHHIRELHVAPLVYS